MCLRYHGRLVMSISLASASADTQSSSTCNVEKYIPKGFFSVLLALCSTCLPSWVKLRTRIWADKRLRRRDPSRTCAPALLVGLPNSHDKSVGFAMFFPVVWCCSPALAAVD
jgi:hypothetical protein